MGGIESYGGRVESRRESEEEEGLYLDEREREAVDIRRWGKSP